MIEKSDERRQIAKKDGAAAARLWRLAGDLIWWLCATLGQTARHTVLFYCFYNNNCISSKSKQTTMEENKLDDGGDNQPRQKLKQTKKRRPFGESTRIAYSSISFEKCESSGRPRSPHRFFSSSRRVAFSKEAGEKDERTEHNQNDDTDTAINNISQVVHHHVNGLCIVTAGEQLPSSIESIQFVVKEAPACSRGEKRKRQAKMLKGGRVEGSVSPSTVIAELKVQSGETVPLYACVFGNILELNHSLTAEVLKDDPLLDGYLAVILPSGDFPPKQEKPKDSGTPPPKRPR